MCELVLFTVCFFFRCAGTHRVLHILPHFFPTRRASILQILKYLGDGRLACFQLADRQDPAPLCAAALTAAERALAAVDDLNAARHWPSIDRKSKRLNSRH